MTKPINVAIIGFGFMGVTHARAYLRGARDGLPCRLATICDPALTTLEPPARFSLPPEMLPDLAGVPLVPSLDSILADPNVHLLSICTPTHTHVDLASRALRAGKHVLVEKPVSLDPEAIEALGALAVESGRLCMPAMCMRFWPAWRLIADAIRDARFGPVRAATFQRLAHAPDWAPFYAEPTLSGGPLFDLHIHDADFVLHALGAPTRVETTGSETHFHTRYTIPLHNAHVAAEASWNQSPEQGFVMRCTIEFDTAAIDFDLARTPQLIITTPDAQTVAPLLPDLDGYDREVWAMVTAILEGAPSPPVTLDEAAAVTRILHAERRSLTTARSVPI